MGKFRNVAILVFLLPAALFAESFELKLRKIKVGEKNAFLLPSERLDLHQGEGIRNEPRYRSTRAVRFFNAFGDGKGLPIAFAVDEKSGTGKGFDLLWVDAKGCGDLRRGIKLAGRKCGGSSSVWFPPFKVKVTSAGEDRLLPFQARLTAWGDDRRNYWFCLYPLCIMEGGILIGGVKQKIIVFDANSNGVYGDKGSYLSLTAGNRRSRISHRVSGDRIWIGRGSPKVEEAWLEATPLGKYCLFQGDYYVLDFKNNHSVAISRADVPMGKIHVNTPGFVLELAQEDSILYVSNPDGREANVPVGSYRVVSACFRHRTGGKLWELQGQSDPSGKTVTVKEEALTQLGLGPPLKLVASSRTSDRSSKYEVIISFHIEGDGGEKYEAVKKNGEKIDLPEIYIRGPRGGVVEKGTFGYS
jgi:hypothetical protein